MLRNHTQCVPRVVALSVLVGLSGAAAAATAQSVSGEAYGAYVQTPVASQGKTPLAVLPSVSPGNGEMAEASGQSLSVPGALSSELVTSLTTGAIGSTKSSAQSVATVSDVSILNGLITAARVIGVATTWRNGFTTTSEGDGSGFEGLTVAGVSMPAEPAPNTRMNLPGVGYVVLNEQIRSASGITVNMIHVVLQSVTGGGCTPLGCLPEVTTTIGEIVVGSASSAVR